MKPGATIVLCSSVNFYKHLIELADELATMGFVAIAPENARKMAGTGDYDADKIRTWYRNAADFRKKAAFMRHHFEEVAAGDAVLIVNDEKHGVQGYIGPNALLEMGLAFYLHKPIYVLNDIDKSMSNYEEIYGMLPTFLNGDITAVGA